MVGTRPYSYCGLIAALGSQGGYIQTVDQTPFAGNGEQICSLTSRINFPTRAGGLLLYGLFWLWDGGCVLIQCPANYSALF